MTVGQPSYEAPSLTEVLAALSATAAGVQRLADKNFALLKADPRHPSLQFKSVGRMWSARVGIHFRALAVESGNDLVWFWIGSHAEYNEIIKR